ncbi:MAG: hypothetical protein KGO05_01845 [Chloroflexota bacterium]|nr:hypothetical protein [Chloroflexota bacterium]
MIAHLLDMRAHATYRVRECHKALASPLTKLMRKLLTLLIAQALSVVFLPIYVRHHVRCVIHPRRGVVNEGLAFAIRALMDAVFTDLFLPVRKASLSLREPGFFLCRAFNSLDLNDFWIFVSFYGMVIWARVIVLCGHGQSPLHA